MSGTLHLSEASRSLQRDDERLCRRLGAGALGERRAAIERHLARRGVAFHHQPSGGYFRRPGGDGMIVVDPVPYAVSGDDWDRLAHGYAQRLQVVNELLRALAGGDSGLIPPEIRDAHARDLGALAVLAEQPCPVTFMGSDIMISRAGQPVLVEDNVCAAGAAVYPVMLNEASRGVMPEFDHGREVGLSEVGAAVRRIHEELCDTYSSPRMVYLSHGPGDVNFVESVLIAGAAGFTLADPEDVEVAADGTARLVLADGSRSTVDLVYCNQSARYTVSHRLLEAVPKGKVRVVNHPAAFALNDKYLLRSVPELIRRHLKVEPELAQAQTLLMTDPDERRAVLDGIRDYVIKPRRGVGGRDVTVTALATDAEIEAVRRKVLAEPDGYLAQPRVDSGTPLCLGGGAGGARLTRSVVDVRITGYHGHRQFVSPTPSGRTDLDGKGLVNISAGGAFKPVHLR
jgi:uncharacterized circularly permuted ATP-grasp superfamily protein